MGLRLLSSAEAHNRDARDMAAHPYPTELVSTWNAPDGSVVVIRPIRPEDAGIEREFVNALSPEAKYMRFMSTLKELTPAMLARFTQIDYDREMALIAVTLEGAREEQIGVCRYIVNPDDTSCEFAIVVGEAWQRRGLGEYLMERLVETARGRGLKRMTGQIFSANTGMLDLATKLGFTLADAPGAPATREATLILD